MAANQHWVEELFPPTFQLTADEIINDDSLLKSNFESAKEQTESVFKKLASRLSPLDPDSIKNVYERVWLLEYLSKTGNLESNDALLSHGSLRLTLGKTKDASTSTHDFVSSESDCIWDAEEIHVLRTCFKSTSAETHKLNAELKATLQELKILKTKNASQSSVAAEQNTALQEACKANQRLKILCDSLMKQNTNAENTVADLNAEVKSLKQVLRKYVKRNQTLEKDLEIEKVQRAALETSLAMQRQEATREAMTLEATLKARHQLQMEKMRGQREGVEEQLEREKKDHERSRRGLEHLQKHFASVVNVESRDELRQWKYQSNDS